MRSLVRRRLTRTGVALVAAAASAGLAVPTALTAPAALADGPSDAGTCQLGNGPALGER
jgi:hypothetical protein